MRDVVEKTVSGAATKKSKQSSYATVDVEGQQSPDVL